MINSVEFQLLIRACLELSFELLLGAIVLQSMLVVARFCSNAFCFHCAVFRWRLVASWGARLAQLLSTPGRRPGCKNLRTKLRRRRPILFENVLAINIYKFHASIMS